MSAINSNKRAEEKGRKNNPTKPKIIKTFLQQFEKEAATAVSWLELLFWVLFGVLGGTMAQLVELPSLTPN